LKFETTPAFDGDVRRLKRHGHFDVFLAAVRDSFIPAAERHVLQPADPWPRGLRVKDVEGAPGVWEMTWEWPDGRATFEWTAIDGEPAIRWRRVGSHAIFRDP
jgi:hypothetical protein